MRRLRVLEIATVVFLAQSIAAQQPARASLEGVVTRLGTNEALRNVAVELRPVGGTGPAVAAALTAEDGKFVIPSVPAGTYRLVATRAGYLKSEYGQRSYGGPTLPLTLSGGQKATGIQLVLTPGGVISGRLTDRGQPVGIADVFALKPLTMADGLADASQVLSAKTNDLGEFHLFWLPPGSYYVAAIVNDTSNNSVLMLSADGDNNNSTLYTERRVLRAVLNRAIGSGATENEMHVPMFFPGTAEIQAARLIDVVPGGEVRNVDIDSPLMPLYHVRGRVSGVLPVNAGEQARPTVSLVPANASSTGGGGSAQVEQNGLFDIPRVPVGSYFLRLFGIPTATVPVEVRGEVSNAVLTVSSGVQPSGRIVIERASTMSPDPLMAGLRVILDSEARPSTAYTLNVAVDGSFKLPANTATAGIPYGDYRVVVTPILQTRPRPNVAPQPVPPAFQNAYVKSIRFGDVDLLQDGFRLQSEPREPLVIVVGTNPGALNGRVLNERKEPVASVWVALIPEGRFRFRSDHKFTSSDASGRFQLDNVPPGDYKLFAWEDVQKGDWQEPGFMRNYENMGTPVRIEEGRKITSEIVAIPPKR